MKLNYSDLHEYQKFVINHILNNPYAGELLDMGLGKTVCTLTAIDKLLYDELEINKVLIVAPKRVVESVWKNEANNWEHLHRLKIINVVGTEAKRLEALRQKADIYVISRDSLKWLVENNLFANFDTLVLDELSSFKSIKSQRFKAARKIRARVKRAIGLTGTPAPNGLIDIWAQIFLLDVGQRLGRTLTSYRETYFETIIRPGQSFPKYELKSGSEKIIHSKISDICISMKAKDYIAMPDHIINKVIIEMPKDLKAKYKDFESTKVLELIDSDEEITAVNAAVLTGKLIQFANGAIYDDNRNINEIHDLKLKELEGIVDEANGEPVIVSYLFQHDLSRIKTALSAYKPRELKTPQDIIDWNNKKIPVLLVHPASVGHGLNLQKGGHIIIWFGVPWSLELYMQLLARLLRQGQTEPTVISHFLLLEGTLDTDVLATLNNKQATQRSLMDAVKARINNYRQLKIDFK